MSTEPTMGPVQGERHQHEGQGHEEDAASPFESALESLLLTIHEGMVISNAPKNDSEDHEHEEEEDVRQWCVASQLKMSARHGVAAEDARDKNDRRDGQRVEGHDEESVHAGAQASHGGASGALL